MILKTDLNPTYSLRFSLSFALLALFTVGLLLPAEAQKAKLDRVEPAFWWADMHHNELQLMVHGKNISSTRVALEYPGVKLKQVREVENPNYLFVDLIISDQAEPGTFDIRFEGRRTKLSYTYELKKRDTNRTYAQGFDASDVIYLMMPDRFANSNPENDEIVGMLEGVDRSDPNARQGGDIEGVMEHLDYIKNLGMTAIWFTPVLENDMPPEYGAYHGYAATDLYRIDRRFGDNDQFLKLVELCHENDMKVIMDMIHNHIGDRHWWMEDLPTEDWLNDYEKFGNTNYRAVTVSDPYASEYDRNKMVNGWFVSEMPDLNQKNELLATYLKQNTLWWIEYAGIDGIRMDTYPYPDKEYMSDWVAYVLEAYPDFNVVGEAWVNAIAIEAYWQDDTRLGDDYDSNLPSVTDFPMQKALTESFTTGQGWLSGIEKLYYTLGQDFVYSDPFKNVIFLDNHDLTRYFSQIGENKEAFKMGYALLMTTRGIPQVYYGTELMFANKAGYPKDAGKRPTMPGGFPGDERSVFTEEGRTELENEIFEYVSRITNWRKENPVMHSGQLTQFLPENNAYVFFRYNDQKKVMVAVNLNEEPYEMDRERFSEHLDGYNSGFEIITQSEVKDLANITVPARTAMIVELK